ncbi:MAG: hypothetical protein ACO1OC_08035 [Tuberibacillus sp.]
MYQELQNYKEKGSLLYITYVVQKVGRKSVWAKIIEVSETERNVLLYDVDSKTVEQININQIDDIEGH